MRILMLNYEFPPVGGGAANANYYLLKEFSKKKGLHIDLITSSPDKKRIEAFSDNIKIYRIDVKKKGMHHWKMIELLRWSIKANKLAHRLAKKNKYDLCHCWFGWPSGFLGYKLWKKIKLPYIVALRGSDVPGYNVRLKMQDKLVFGWLSRKIWRKAKNVITNSEGLKELALNTSKRKIDVIYNGVDILRFKPRAKKKSKKIRLVSVGRLIERKGYKYLIKAMKGLDKFELKIIGEGNQEKELREIAEKYNVDVEFKGKVSHHNIAHELKDSDVFVLPSLNEGMSNAVLEAMACGLPIIATDVGGSKELVKGNGFVVKKGSVSAIRKVLTQYNKKLIVKQSKKSRKLAEKMSWEKMANKYMRMYK